MAAAPIAAQPSWLCSCDSDAGASPESERAAAGADGGALPGSVNGVAVGDAALKETFSLGAGGGPQRFASAVGVYGSIPRSSAAAERKGDTQAKDETQFAMLEHELSFR